MPKIAVFDLETTGTDPRSDRIVTAFFGILDAKGTLLESHEWIVDPGVPIPQGASDVHGFTKAALDADHRTRHDPQQVTVEIARTIWRNCGDGPRLPLAGHNIAYDLTMLDSHLFRDGRVPLPYGPGRIRVLDSLVLDKHYDRYVKGTGQRKLTPTAQRYGIDFTAEQAHDASFDAVASGRICQAILALHANPRGTLSFDTLHLLQRRWRAEQQKDLEAWLRANRDPQAICEPGWPSYAADMH